MERTGSELCGARSLFASTQSVRYAPGVANITISIRKICAHPRKTLTVEPGIKCRRHGPRRAASVAGFKQWIRIRRAHVAAPSGIDFQGMFGLGLPSGVRRPVGIAIQYTRKWMYTPNAPAACISGMDSSFR